MKDFKQLLGILLLAGLSLSCGGSATHGSSAKDGGGAMDDGGAIGSGGTGDNRGTADAGGAIGSGGATGSGIMPAPATCGAVLPCGGDLTGTWKVLGGCIPAAGLVNQTCQNTIQLVGLSFAGSVTFNGDMTYTATSLTETVAETYSFPNDCLAGRGETCADLNSVFGGSCTASNACTCSASDTRT